MLADTATAYDTLIEHVERFIAEVDGIAEFERLRSGGMETPTVRYIDDALTGTLTLLRGGRDDA